jgi:hypothetical protein
LASPALAKVQAEIAVTVEWATRKLVDTANEKPAELPKHSDRNAAIRTLADIHGWNAPKKIAPTNAAGDGPAEVKHQLDLSKLTDDELEFLDRMLRKAAEPDGMGAGGDKEKEGED